jgi:hypothetical protein
MITMTYSGYHGMRTRREDFTSRYRNVFLILASRDQNCVVFNEGIRADDCTKITTDARRDANPSQ